MRSTARGRGASYLDRSHTERSGGPDTRENAGISSESEVRILTVESLRFPGEGSSAQGKSAPKARPKGVVYGKRVYIPVPPVYDDDSVTLKQIIMPFMTWATHVLQWPVQRDATQ